jgi:hypothetical protein
MSRPKHFKIGELADPSIIAENGEEATWQMLDPSLFPALDWLRDVFGPILINGGRFKESGLRRKDTKTGSPRSAHKAGQAYDLKPLAKDVTVQQVYHFIIENEAEAMSKGITELEDIMYTPTWLHVSCRPHSLGNRIRIVRP